MSIYSVNRSGSMALAQVVANESYTSEDFGRILYETQVNDMAFFEAVLGCDFNEIKGLREGTILESEVAALNEASFSAIVEKLCNGLKSFWAKLKAAFQNAIDKVAAWSVSYGKKTVEKFNTVGNKVASWDGKIEDVVVYDLDHKCYQIPKGNVVSTWIKTLNSQADVDTAEIVGWELAEKVDASQKLGIKEFTKQALQASSKKVTLNLDAVNEFKKTISGAGNAITKLKKNQRDAEKSINETMKELRNAAKAADDEKASVIKLNGIVHAYQTYVATVAKVGIQAVRNDLRSRNAALLKAYNDINKSTKEFSEACILEAADDFDAFMSSNLNLDAETQAEVDALVNAE